MEHFTAEVQRIRPAAPGQQVIEFAADERLARIIRNRNVRYVASRKVMLRQAGISFLLRHIRGGEYEGRYQRGYYLFST